jgi:hypothetical protein
VTNVVKASSAVKVYHASSYAKIQRECFVMTAEQSEIREIYLDVSARMM